MTNVGATKDARPRFLVSARARPRIDIVHIAGRMTDEVFSLVGPMTDALARTGYKQAIVIFDQYRYRQNLLKLDESIDFFLIARARNPFSRLRDLTQSARSVLANNEVRTLHLHGVTSCLAGAWIARTARGRYRFVYSPHSSKTLGWLRGVAALAFFAMPKQMRPSSNSAIVNLVDECVPLSGFGKVEVIESPVAMPFFDAVRREARRPLIVARGRHDCVRAVELFAQLAVLLTGEPLNLAFNWLGTVDEISRLRLNAAGVAVFDVQTTRDVVARLETGWMYVAAGGESGFPIHLVEAMASGLACVAIDRKQHRDVIVDGETGFLCASEREMMERVALLIDRPSLRSMLGARARERARARFGEVGFTSRIVRHYESLTSVAS